MLIAVEGPDGVGKSTFVSLLASLLPGAEVRHNGPPTKWAVEEYEVPLQDYRPGAGQHVIYDRLHVGEQVYGPIYRGHGMNPREYEHVTGFMASKGLVTVFLMPPTGLVMENLAERGDTMVSATTVPQLVQEYRKQIKNYKLPTLVVDRYPTEIDAQQAIRLADRMETMVTPVADFESFVGWMFPQVLLVGDAKSSMAGPFTSAFVPWLGKSGDFLLGAVLTKYVTWAMVNANEAPVFEVVNAIRPERVVMLGANAARECAASGSMGVLAPHPSWAKRFGHMAAYQYAELI